MLTFSACSQVLLSVTALLSLPNTSSPANIDAAADYKDWIDEINDNYERKVKRSVLVSKRGAAKDGVKIPMTREDYCNTALFESIDSSDDSSAVSGDEFSSSVSEQSDVESDEATDENLSPHI